MPVSDRDTQPGAEDPDRVEMEPEAELDYGLAAAFEESGEWSAGPPPSVLETFDSTAAILERLCLQSAHGAEVEPVPRIRSREVPAEPTGRYQIHGEISRGGMGAVLRARDIDLGRDLAVKVLLSQHMQRPEMLERFIEEAQIGGQLQHPGVLPVHELGRFADGRPYFTMKFVRGKTLESLLRDRESTNEDRARLVGIFEQVCQTVAYAHASGVVHRDLKPANIMVGSFGEVQVMDWGLAKVLVGGEDDERENRPSTPDAPAVRTTSSVASGTGSGSRSATQAGSVLGTPAYMAPEQARGEVHAIDERTDVFGLGAILAEILTGEPPFLGDPKSAHALARAGDLTGAYARLDGCGADSVLVELSKRCLAAEPSARPRTGSEVAEAVSEHLESVEKRLRQTELERVAERARAEEAHGKALAERRARRRTVALAATVLVAVTLGSVVWLSAEKRESARLAKLSGEIHSALENAVAEREKARAAGPSDLAAWNAARSEAERARALAGGETIDAELRARIERINAEIAGDERDRQFVAELERIYREEYSEFDSEHHHYSYKTTAEKYRRAFARYGIAASQSTPEEIAASSSERPERVRETLVLAFDHWLERVRDDNEPESEWLRNVLDAVDKSEWRRAVRAAGSLEELEALAENEEEVLRQSPAIVVRLGRALIEVGATERAVELLRQAQERQPDDYWLSTSLASALQRKKPPEAVWYYRVALALRPDDASYFNLAHALAEAGDFAGGIACLRRRLERDHEGSSESSALFCMAHMFRDLGDNNAAEKHYRRALRIDPEYVDALFNLGNTLRARGDFEAAVEHYKKAIESDPNYSKAYLNLGYTLESQGDFDAAIEQYRRAIEAEPRYVAAYVNLGKVLMDQGNLTAAVDSCKKAIELDPESAPAYHHLGIVLTTQGDFTAAIKQYKEAIRLDPNFVEAYVDLGHNFQSQGDLTAAVDSWKKAIELESDTEALTNLGVLLYRQGQLVLAVDSYAKVLRIDPRHVRALVGLGEARHAQREAIAAIDHYKKAIDIDPDYAWAHINLGNVLQDQGDIDGAIACFKKAIEIDPELAESHYNLGNARKIKQEFSRAREHYEKAIELDPNHVNALINLGVVLADSGDRAAAREHYKKAIEIRSDVAVPHFNLGHLDYADRNLEKAVEHFENAIRIDPDYAAAHLGLGNALMAQGRPTGASEHYEKSVELKPRDFRARFKLASALRAQGLFAAAAENYEKAIELSPDFAEAHCNLGGVLAAQGKFSESLDALRKGHELGSPRPDWPYPSAQWVERAEREATLEAQLEEILSGTLDANSAEELLEYRAICYAKRLYAAASRLDIEALERKPELAEDFRRSHRYNAACDAALAAAGAGTDASDLDDDRRVELRARALEWLQADLKSWRTESQGDEPEARRRVAAVLAHWRRDGDLSSVRDVDALGHLTESEADRWRELWSEVEKLAADVEEG